MTYRDFWQDTIDLIWDAVNNLLNTQEEIDALVNDAFGIFYATDADPATLPPSFRRRRIQFLSPVDLIEWVKRGAIPPTSVAVQVVNTSATERRYKLYVSTETDP